MNSDQRPPTDYSSTELTMLFFDSKANLKTSNLFSVVDLGVCAYLHSIFSPFKKAIRFPATQIKVCLVNLGVYIRKYDLFRLGASKQNK